MTHRIRMMQLEMPPRSVRPYRDRRERDGSEYLADGLEEEGGVAWDERRGQRSAQGEGERGRGRGRTSIAGVEEGEGWCGSRGSRGWG